MSSTRPRTHRPDTADDSGSAWTAWLTRVAFVVAAGLVLARVTMLETLRDPFDVQPGSEATPSGPGAGAGLLLDLLACVPALLVLARRAFDRTYALRSAWSFVPLALLGVWTVASTVWAGDRFAAAVAGTHWLCAGVFLWSAAQLVRDWTQLRLVAAVGVGLLLVQAGKGLSERYIDHPDVVASWRQNRETILKQRGWDSDSFIARQFEKRVLSAEMMGFNSSSNTFGAVLVLLTFVAAGNTIQRITDRDGAAWAVAPAAAACLGLLVIFFVNSRAAMATPVLGAAALAAVWLFRITLMHYARLVYAAAVCGFFVAASALVAHGLYHGTLFHDSLTFRWRYWVAAARLVAQHPFAGVGWENFGSHYLAVRLPVAAEEVKDPHNFLMRFAAELGAVGLALVLAWLLRLGWELTRPASANVVVNDAPPEPEAAARPVSVLATIAAVGCFGTFVNVLASIDWSQDAAYNALELMRRVGFLCLFVVGAALAALRSAHSQDLDDRPAPALWCALLVGLGLFLLHNLIDFSLFEPGPMFLFTFLCGAALGIRAGEAPAAAGRGRGIASAALAAAVLAWVVGLGAFAVPVVRAEREAAAGDDALRRLNYRLATSQFERALAIVPYNADYAFRAARAALADPRQADPSYAVGMLDRAIALDPYRPQYWLHRAYARPRDRSPDAAAIRADYEAALRLDPNNVDVRIEYADVLRRFGDSAAAAQYREALRYNDLLSPDEPKRLSPPKLNEILRAIAELGASG